MISPGETPPDFTLLTDEGKPLTLSSQVGKRVVLYFYPKADTPGWTIEASEFRDAFPQFEGLDAVILGISPDTVAAQAKFKKKLDLPFTLLADEGHAVAEQYGVWQEKVNYGKTYMGVVRTTFLIGRDGRVTHVFEKVNAKGHAAEVAAALEASGGIPSFG
jgi:thioredoxin-dependent peroxiredoxin